MTAPVRPAVVPLWDFADRLRKARQLYAAMTNRRRVTQAEFAALLGEDPKKYENWEAGYNNPRNLIDVARRVERLTGIPASWLLWEEIPEGSARVEFSRKDEAADQGRFSGADPDEFLAAIPHQRQPAAVA